jgi:hypothetical protein
MLPLVVSDDALVGVNGDQPLLLFTWRYDTDTGDSESDADQAMLTDRDDTNRGGVAREHIGGDRSSTNDALAFVHARPAASTHDDTNSNTPSPPTDTFTHRVTTLPPSIEPTVTPDHATVPFKNTLDVTLLASDMHTSTSLALRLYGGGGRGSHVDGATVSTIVLTLSNGDGDTLPAASTPYTCHT